jgi:hypothetical protein
MSDALPFGKDRKPEYPQIEPRRPLTRWEFAVLFLQQAGQCKNCGAKLEKGKTRDEHLVALAIGGDNSLSNRALWCLDCTKPKDRSDKARIAKSKRIKGETCNGPTRKIQSRGFLSPSEDRASMDGKKWQTGGRTLQGRPFNKTLRRKFNGKVEAR